MRSPGYRAPELAAVPEEKPEDGVPDLHVDRELGVAAFILGGADDSLGLQGIGVLLVGGGTILCLRGGRGEKPFPMITKCAYDIFYCSLSMRDELRR